MTVFRKWFWSLIAAILSTTAAGGAPMSIEGGDKRHVVLIGASVGKAWNLEGLPQRIVDDSFDMKYVGCYRYDKSEALDELLGRQKRPDAIILKECAAYFPSEVDLEEAKRLMTNWVLQCRNAGVVPVLATVAPVTRERDERYRTRNPAKRFVKKILGIRMMTQMEAIAKYNDWIREFATSEDLALLDLEAVLRNGPSDRYLRPDLSSGDGLHLNDKAYGILDLVVAPVLKAAFSRNSEGG